MYKLELSVNGISIAIESDLSVSDFLQQMLQTINQRSADPTFSGFFRFKKIIGKKKSDIWVRIRSIDAVADLENIEKIAEK